MNPEIRLAEDTDSEAIIQIVGLCYALYPNCILDVDLEEAEYSDNEQPASQGSNQFQQIVQGHWISTHFSMWATLAN